MTDETIEDKTREVPEQEFALFLNDTLKKYETQIEKYQQAIYAIQKQEQDIVTVFKDINMYKALNFKMSYHFNETKEEYEYHFKPREVIGFKTK